MISLTNVLNQTMQVLKWFTCLTLVPISQLLLWELSIVNVFLFSVFVFPCLEFFVAG